MGWLVLIVAWTATLITLDVLARWIEKVERTYRRKPYEDFRSHH